jgi:hypothetical protein
VQQFPFLIALTLLVACATAKPGPQTTNPPLTPDQKKMLAGPPADPDSVQDGHVVRFPKMGFQMTMTEAPWSGQVEKKKDGSKQVAMERRDYRAVLQIIPVIAPDFTGETLCEDQRKKAIEEGLAPDPVTAETPTRFAFTVDNPTNTPPLKSYLAVVPLPDREHGFLIFLGTTDLTHVDAFFADVRELAASIAPLPKVAPKTDLAPAK